MPFTDNAPVEFMSSTDAKNVLEPGNKVNLDICDSANTGATQSIKDQARADRTEADLIRSNFKDNWDVMEGTTWYKNYADMLSPASGGALGTAFARNGPIGSLATVMVYTLLVPFLALMTTLASVKVVSPMIGGDVEISLLSRII